MPPVHMVVGVVTEAANIPVKDQTDLQPCVAEVGEETLQFREVFSLVISRT